MIGKTNRRFWKHFDALYTTADRKAWDDGADFTMKHMWPQLADVSFKDLHKLDVPTIFLLGRHDYTTPSEISSAWLEKLQAPKKEIVWFENSAHLPMIEEPGHMLVVLFEKVRPLAREETAP